jgi:hypothetical protein
VTTASTDSGGVILSPGDAATPEDLAAAQARQELLKTGLQNVRKAAESWRTGLVALLALIGTVSVVKGRESFTDLASPGPLLVGACLALALTAAAIGSYRTMRAAFGEPRQRETAGILYWDQQDATDAVSQLNAGKWDFFLALPALALAMALTWYAPESPPSPLALVRVDDGGTVVCGKLVRGTALGITVESDGSSKLVRFSNLRSLALTEEC